MKKEYENGVIYLVSKSYDRERVIKSTEEFLKKVISEEKRNANSNTTRTI